VNTANSFKIEVGGAPLSEDLASLLVSAYVDDSLNVPDMFVLTFRDPQKVLFQQGTLDIGKKVTISLVSDAANAGEKLISEAEVTALEVEFDPSGTRSVVRGFDQTHRLFRGRHTEGYKNMSYSDVAKKVAQRNGLATGTIDSTGVVHELVSQVNMSDWQFLNGLAREVGYEVAATAGKLEFRKPKSPSAAPSSGDLNMSDPLKLVLGDNLLRFRCSVSSAEQVKEIKVRSWDPAQKQVLMGSASAHTSSVALAEDPGQLAGKFGSPVHTAVGTPFATQSECDAAAKALAEEIGGAFASFDGVASGNLKLRAGGAVSLGLVGKPFDGRYKLTTTRHVYDPHDGYQTWFTVSGRQERSLGGLTSGAGGSVNGSASGRPIAGVVQAIVTNAKDPLNLCRVKVKFPWLSDTYESDWARTVQLSAGNGYGSVMVPEVGDEVLVAFEQGDLRRPYLIGGLYNGQDKPPAGAPDLIDSSSGKVNRRGFVSRTGHTLSFAEKEGTNDGILLKTAGDKYVIELSKKNQKVTINADGSIEIEAKGGPGAVKITAAGDLDLKARKISVKADSGVEIDGGAGNVDVKGVQISAKGTAKLSMEAATISVNASATAELKGGAMVNVQGALVKIN
jgi:phage protein D/phage baseplate assembly protein gpV